MTGPDHKAQALASPGETLMEHAGTAVAAAARALLEHNGRMDRPVLILAGPGNNGGDGFVAARRLAEWGVPVIAVLVAAEERPGTPDAARNWKRLDGLDRVTKIHAPVARDVAILGQGIEQGRRSSSTPCSAPASAASSASPSARRSRSSAGRARRASRSSPSTRPTAVDLTSGDPPIPSSAPTSPSRSTGRRPGSARGSGKALAGRILVAPIGIPPEVDRASAATTSASRASRGRCSWPGRGRSSRCSSPPVSPRSCRARARTSCSTRRS